MLFGSSAGSIWEYYLPREIFCKREEGKEPLLLLLFLDLRTFTWSYLVGSFPFVGSQGTIIMCMGCLNSVRKPCNKKKNEWARVGQNESTFAFIKGSQIGKKTAVITSEQTSAFYGPQATFGPLTIPLWSTASAALAVEGDGAAALQTVPVFLVVLWEK